MPEAPGTMDDCPVAELIDALSADDEMRRQQARHTLVARGGDAVPGLIEALRGGSRLARWEAAKALASSANASAAPALVEALEDEDDAVRWQAAVALVRLDRVGLEAVLGLLIRKPKSHFVRTSVHHVLHEIGRHGWEDVCEPVVGALEGHDPLAAAAVAAEHAMAALRDRPDS